MNIKFRPCGIYQTNCYIVERGGESLIIDPGVDATNWVLKNAKNPIAILNTHGHFDHIWSNRELKERLKIPIYAPKDDAFMLEKDPFNQGVPKSKADFRVERDATLEIGNFNLIFRHFPGHTPGTTVIEIGNVWFSGDFLFKNSIGRWDFPFSNPSDMIKSLIKVSKIDKDFLIYPGHNNKTTLKSEQRFIDFWIRQVQRS